MTNLAAQNRKMVLVHGILIFLVISRMCKFFVALLEITKQMVFLLRCLLCVLHMELNLQKRELASHIVHNVVATHSSEHLKKVSCINFQTLYFNLWSSHTRFPTSGKNRCWNLQSRIYAMYLFWFNQNFHAPNLSLIPHSSTLSINIH